MRLGLTGVVLASLGSSSLAAAMSSPSTSPTGTAARGWGWGVVRQPQTASYPLSNTDGRDSAAATPTYQRESVGHSVVTFPGISNGFIGVPVVTPFATTSRQCAIVDWQSIASGSYQPNVIVDCFRADGQLADTRFSLNFVIHGDVGPNIAYLYTFCGTTGCSTTVSHNPTGGTNTVQRSGVGTYMVALPGMATGVGNVQLSAQSSTPLACRATSLSIAGSELDLGVTCRDLSGGLADGGFLLDYARGVGLTGDAGRKAAFLLATRPAASSYHPAASFRFSSAGTVPTITRSGPGTYLITLPGMPAGGSAQVTPYGLGSARCTLTSIRPSGTPQRIGVRCSKPDGTAINSKFSLTYTH
jgi:hypothetical protein